MEETGQKRREFVFGDIHGCADALKIIVHRIALTAVDRVIVLGDAVDRGPDTRAVLDKLLEIRSTCEMIFILGNHEEMMLDAASGHNVDGWLRHGGKATLASYNGRFENIPDKHFELLDTAVEFWEGESAICVHANLEPGVALEEQRPSWLRWHKLTGREFPHSSGKRIVCGHSGVSRSAPSVRDGWVCLDTLVHNGGYLSAVELGTEELFQAKQSGEFRSGVFLHELDM